MLVLLQYFTDDLGSILQSAALNNHCHAEFTILSIDSSVTRVLVVVPSLSAFMLIIARPRSLSYERCFLSPAIISVINYFCYNMLFDVHLHGGP